jgi:hypothetical protein
MVILNGMRNSNRLDAQSSPHERSDMRDGAKDPDIAEPVIGCAFRATRWLIRATAAALSEVVFVANCHCEERSGKAIHLSAHRDVDCLAEPVIIALVAGRAFARPGDSQ